MPILAPLPPKYAQIYVTKPTEVKCQSKVPTTDYRLAGPSLGPARQDDWPPPQLVSFLSLFLLRGRTRNGNGACFASHEANYVPRYPRTLESFKNT